MREFLPDQVLFSRKHRPRNLAAVDHYAGIERFMYKALQMQIGMKGLFDLTLDFEDGSSAGHEKEQAQLITAVLNDSNNLYGRVGIRIHDASSRFWRMQCEQTIRAGSRPPAYVTLPKVTSITQVKTVTAYVAQLSKQAGFTQGVPLHVMVEEPGVFGELEAIVRLADLECVSFGLLDYVSSFGGALPMSLIDSPNEFDSPIINDAKVRISTLCNSHGKVPSHSLCSELNSVEVIEKHAMRAFNVYGFRRMWSIHPNQIEPILKASRPNNALIERAARILMRAFAQSWAPISDENQLHDRASYRYFWSVLKAAYLSNMELPTSTTPLFAFVSRGDSNV